ncbi:hypothetical protein ORJ00_10000 [Rheinheimera baltica]|uniref:glycosyltransferase family 25 protein n=1 Tax=Rheinheimera baltica TaxID=67576 RepID=UPI00273E7AEE|nr:glycosyltransferase family 25 protein [Rheinheimera baltica]MDP5143076.1 hypothetical protein [Rheinheimera baltica]
MPDNRIQQVCVVSLPEDTERREHVKRHFTEIGIDNFTFSDGVAYNSQAVKQFYLSNRVKAPPNCFRCNQRSCSCPNNILIPQQVANWLAFKKAWVKAAIHEGLTMICEDDVLFYPGAMGLLSLALDKINLQTEEPLLIRMGHSGLDTQVSLLEKQEVNITQAVVMSNVAFILNQAMARLLLSRFVAIETTSDIFIHNWAAKFERVNAYTIEPLLATDLSYNKDYAKFVSRIHPKGIDETDTQKMQTHVKRANTAKEYQLLLNIWMNT